MIECACQRRYGNINVDCDCLTPDDCMCEGNDMTDGREELRQALIDAPDDKPTQPASGGISVVDDGDCAGLPADQMAQCLEDQAAGQELITPTPPQGKAKGRANAKGLSKTKLYENRATGEQVTATKREFLDTLRAQGYRPVGGDSDDE